MIHFYSFNIRVDNGLDYHFKGHKILYKIHINFLLSLICKIKFNKIEKK